VLVRSLLIGRRKQWHVILPIVLVLFGVREMHHGDFSSEQLLNDPLKNISSLVIILKILIAFSPDYIVIMLGEKLMLIMHLWNLNS